MTVTGEASRIGPGLVVNGLYRLERLLGEGGMGQVWEARHERTRGRVALKILLPALGGDESLLARFRREAELTSALNHPNIVQVSDFDRLPDGRPYLVMEYLEGHDLAGELERRGALPLAEAAEILEQTAIGLHAAHERGIIHRDLKPANLFIVPLAGSSRFLVKILDFGISKAADGANALTKTQTVIGTPNYMAPEQAIAASTSLDARADQFALAAIAYELVTGRKAFDGPHVLAVLYSVVNDRPPTFASLGLALGAEIEAVIARGLEKPAADRYPSVLDFSRAFRAAIGAAPAANEASAPAATLVLPALDQVVQGGKAATTARPTNPPPASSSSHATDQPSASGRTLGRRWLIAAVAIIALSALAIALALSGRDQEGPAASNPATPATPPAKATAPAESTKPSETAPEPAAPALAPSAPPPQPKPAPPDEATESPPKSTRSEKIRPTTKPKRPKVPLNESL